MILDLSTSPPSLSFDTSAKLVLEAGVKLEAKASLYFGSISIPFGDVGLDIGDPARMEVSLNFDGSAARAALAGSHAPQRDMRSNRASTLLDMPRSNTSLLNAAQHSGGAVAPAPAARGSEVDISFSGQAHLTAELTVGSLVCDMRVTVKDLAAFLEDQPGSFVLSSQACPGDELVNALIQKLEEAALAYLLLDSGRLEQQLTRSWLEEISMLIEHISGVDVPLAGNKWVEAIADHFASKFFSTHFFKTVLGPIQDQLLRLVQNPTHAEEEVEQGAIKLFAVSLCRAVEAYLPSGYCTSMPIPQAGVYPYVFRFPLSGNLTKGADTVSIDLGDHGTGAFGSSCGTALNVGWSANFDLVRHRQNWTFLFSDEKAHPALEAHVGLKLENCGLSGSLGPLDASVAAKGGVSARATALTRSPGDRWPSDIDAEIVASFAGTLRIGLAGLMEKLFHESAEQALINTPTIETEMVASFSCDVKGKCKPPTLSMHQVKLCWGQLLGPLLQKLLSFTKNKYVGDLMRFADHMTEEDNTIEFLSAGQYKNKLDLAQGLLKADGLHEEADQLGTIVAVLTDIDDAYTLLEPLAGQLGDQPCEDLHQAIQDFELDYSKPDLKPDPKGPAPPVDPQVSSSAFSGKTRDGLKQLMQHTSKASGFGFSIPCINNWMPCIEKMLQKEPFITLLMTLPPLLLSWSKTWDFPVWIVLVQVTVGVDLRLGKNEIGITSSGAVALATGSPGAITAAIALLSKDPETGATIVPLELDFYVKASAGIYLGLINGQVWAEVMLRIYFTLDDFHHRGFVTLADLYYLYHLNGNNVFSVMIITLELLGMYGLWANICIWLPFHTHCWDLINESWSVPLYSKSYTPKSQLPSAIGTDINLNVVSQCASCASGATAAGAHAALDRAYAALGATSSACRIKVAQIANDHQNTNAKRGSAASLMPVHVHIYTADKDPAVEPPQDSIIAAGSSPIGHTGALPVGHSVVYDIYGVMRLLSVPSSPDIIAMIHGKDYKEGGTLAISRTTAVPQGAAGIGFEGQCRLLNVSTPLGQGLSSSYDITGSPCPQALAVTTYTAVTVSGRLTDYGLHPIGLYPQLNTATGNKTDDSPTGQNVTLAVDATVLHLAPSFIVATAPAQGPVLAFDGAQRGAYDADPALNVSFHGSQPKTVTLRSHPTQSTIFHIDAVHAATNLWAGGGKGNNTFFVQMTEVSGGAFFVGNHYGRSSLSLAVDAPTLAAENVSVGISGTVVNAVASGSSQPPIRVSFDQIQEVEVNITSARNGRVESSVLNVPDFSLFHVRALNSPGGQMFHAFGGCSESGTAKYTLSKGNHELLLGVDGHLNTDYKCAVFVKGEQAADQNYTVILNAAEEKKHLQWQIQANTMMVQSVDPGNYWLLTVTFENINNVILRLGAGSNDVTVRTTLQEADLAVYFPDRPVASTPTDYQRINLQQVTRSVMLFGGFDLQVGKMTPMKNQDACATWQGSALLVEGKNSSYSVSMLAGSGATAPRQCYLFGAGCVGVSHCNNGSAIPPLYAPSLWLRATAAAAGFVGDVAGCSIPWSGNRTRWVYSSGDAPDVAHVRNFACQSLHLSQQGGADTLDVADVAGDVVLECGPGDDSALVAPMADAAAANVTLLCGSGGDGAFICAPFHGRVDLGDDAMNDNLEIAMNASHPSLIDGTVGPLGWDAMDTGAGYAMLRHWRREDTLLLSSGQSPKGCSVHEGDGNAGPDSRDGPWCNNVHDAPSAVMNAPPAVLQMTVENGFIRRDLISNAVLTLNTLAEGAIVELVANGESPASNYTVELAAPSYNNHSVVRLSGNPEDVNGSLILVGPQADEGTVALQQTGDSTARSGNVLLQWLVLQTSYVNHFKIMSPLNITGVPPPLAVSVDLVPCGADLVLDSGGTGGTGTVDVVKIASPMLLAGKGFSARLQASQVAAAGNVYVAQGAGVVISTPWSQEGNLTSDGCLWSAQYTPQNTSLWFQAQAAGKSPRGMTQALLSSSCSMVLAGAGYLHVDVGQLFASDLGDATVGNLSLATNTLYLNDSAPWTAVLTDAAGLQVAGRFAVAVAALSPGVTPLVHSLAEATFTENATVSVGCLGEPSAATWFFGPEAGSHPLNASRLVWAPFDFRNSPGGAQAGCLGVVGLKQATVPSLTVLGPPNAGAFYLGVRPRPLASGDTASRLIRVNDTCVDVSVPSDATMAAQHIAWNAASSPELLLLSLDCNKTVVDSSGTRVVAPTVRLDTTLGASAHVLLPISSPARFAADSLLWRPSTYTFTPHASDKKLECLTPRIDCTHRAMEELIFQREEHCSVVSKQQTSCNEPKDGHAGVIAIVPSTAEVECLADATTKGFSPYAGEAAYLGMNQVGSEHTVLNGHKRVARFLLALFVVTAILCAVSLSWCGFALFSPMYVTLLFLAMLLSASTEVKDYGGMSDFLFTMASLVAEAVRKLNDPQFSSDKVRTGEDCDTSGHVEAQVYCILMALMTMLYLVCLWRLPKAREHAHVVCHLRRLIGLFALATFVLAPSALSFAQGGWFGATVVLVIAFAALLFFSDWVVARVSKNADDVERRPLVEGDQRDMESVQGHAVVTVSSSPQDTACDGADSSEDGDDDAPPDQALLGTQLATHEAGENAINDDSSTALICQRSEALVVVIVLIASCVSRSNSTVANSVVQAFLLLVFLGLCIWRLRGKFAAWRLGRTLATIAPFVLQVAPHYLLLGTAATGDQLSSKVAIMLSVVCFCSAVVATCTIGFLARAAPRRGTFTLW